MLESEGSRLMSTDVSTSVNLAGPASGVVAAVMPSARAARGGDAVSREGRSGEGAAAGGIPARAEHLHRPPLDKLCRVILLAGAVRSSPLVSATGRSVLDLPVTSHQTLLDIWTENLTSLAAMIGRPLEVRLLLDRSTPRPVARRHWRAADVESGGLADVANGLRGASKTGGTTNGASGGEAAGPADEAGVVDFTIECDPFEYRGTGGVLRDVTQDIDDGSYVLVANAGQLLLEPLPTLVSEIAGVGGAVCIVGHQDGTPSGFTLVQCGALRRIPTLGYIDFKEQALPVIARSEEVRVLNRSAATGMRVSTTEEYLAALRQHHATLAGRPETADDEMESWRSMFGIAEMGSTIESGVRLHDSVVLAGARVSAGAVVVRSVIAPGARVGRNAVITDRLVSGGAIRR